MLWPDQERTIVYIVSSEAEVRDMPAAGLSIADAALPKTAPTTILQFGSLLILSMSVIPVDFAIAG